MVCVYTAAALLLYGGVGADGPLVASFLFWGSHLGIGFWVGRWWVLALAAWSIPLMVPFAQTAQFQYGDVAAVSIMLLAGSQALILFVGVGARKLLLPRS